MITNAALLANTNLSHLKKKLGKHKVSFVLVSFPIDWMLGPILFISCCLCFKFAAVPYHVNLRYLLPYKRFLKKSRNSLMITIFYQRTTFLCSTHHISMQIFNNNITDTTFQKRIFETSKSQEEREPTFVLFIDLSSYIMQGDKNIAKNKQYISEYYKETLLEELRWFMEIHHTKNFIILFELRSLYNEAERYFKNLKNVQHMFFSERLTSWSFVIL